MLNCLVFQPAQCLPLQAADDVMRKAAGNGEGWCQPFTAGSLLTLRLRSVREREDWC